MKENFLHFLSTVPCSLAINGKELGYIDNENIFEHDIITNTNQVFINYQPISSKKNFIPYSAIIKTANTPNTESEYIEIVPFPNNNYDIIMSPFYYYEVKDTTVLLSQMVDKYFVSVTTGIDTTIMILNGSTIAYKTNTIKLINATAEKKNNLLIIKGVASENEYYLLIINTENFEVIHSGISHSIEESIDSLQSLRFLNNPTHHAEVCKIEYKSQNKEIFYVYQNSTPCTTDNKYLIPLFFLESLKVNDSTICRNLLASNLQSTPLQKFKDYFGNIKNIYLNRHSPSPNINYTVRTEHYKNYDFIIDNGKITEIEEIF